MWEIRISPPLLWTGEKCQTPSLMDARTRRAAKYRPDNPSMYENLTTRELLAIDQPLKQYISNASDDHLVGHEDIAEAIERDQQDEYEAEDAIEFAREKGKIAGETENLVVIAETDTRHIYEVADEMFWYDSHKPELADAVRHVYRQIAENVCDDYDWSASQPVVVVKPESLVHLDHYSP